MADPAISPPEAAPAPAPDHSRRQLEALLDVSEIIAQHRDLNTLFHELATRLHSVVESDFLTLVLHDPERNVMRLHVLESRMETEKTIGFEHPVDASPSGWVWKTQQPFIVEDVLTETRFAEFLGKLKVEGVRSFAALPLTTAQRRLGAMGFGRLRPQAISDSDIRFMQRVAAQVAVAVDNALNFESSQAYQRQLAEQRDRLQVLLEINNAIVSLWTQGLPDDYYQQYAARIAAVRREDVVRVARQYVDLDHLAIVIVGDRATIEGPLRATAIAPIAITDIEGRTAP